MPRILRFRVGKLIRDRLPEIMRADGLQVFDRPLPAPDYRAALRDKLLEEAREATGAATAAELREELADVMEVIRALAAAHGLTLDQIEAARAAKHAARGGFEGAVWNAAVAAPEGSPALDYYLARPDQYPQMESAE
jgi:predicted house-cleaning noncanonical NTP pyrophosphatase (MazG superfamily)